VSFTKRGGPLREHCVQGTDGAAFHPALEISEHALIVSKGQDADYDPCSAFDRTGLESLLRTCGVRRIFVGGLAQDVCVRETVLDALRCGFKTHVLVAATRPMDELEGMRALAEMHANGAVLESYIPLAHDGD
jgi:nicotinamidase/pyrazinamidase